MVQLAARTLATNDLMRSRSVGVPRRPRGGERRERGGGDLVRRSSLVRLGERERPRDGGGERPKRRGEGDLERRWVRSGDLERRERRGSGDGDLERCRNRGCSGDNGGGASSDARVGNGSKAAASYTAIGRRMSSWRIGAKACPGG